MGEKCLLATLLFVLVPIEGDGQLVSRPRDECQLLSFSSNELAWNLECFTFSSYPFGTSYFLKYHELPGPFTFNTPIGEPIYKKMAGQILKLYFIERVYDPLYHFLSWWKNFTIAVKNNVTNENYPCQYFNSNGFKGRLKNTWYSGLRQMRKDDGSFNESQLQSFLQDLPIKVLVYIGYLEYADQSATFSKLEGILSEQIQNSFDYLEGENIHKKITDMSDQASSYLLSVLSATSGNINSLPISWEIEHPVVSAERNVEVCIEQAEELETNVQQSLQTLNHALHNSSISLKNFVVSLLHEPDRTSEGNDQQPYVKSTPTEGVYFTQNSKKGDYYVKTAIR